MVLDPEDHIGDIFNSITLETCREKAVTRPRVRPVDTFPEDIRVEFPRRLRELFPIGTCFLATVRVCRKHLSNGAPNGAPYLSASEIALIPESVPDKGLVAQVKAGSISGLAYEYHMEETY